MSRLYNALTLWGVTVLLSGVTSVVQGAPPQQDPIVFQSRSGQAKNSTKVSRDLIFLREEQRVNRNLVTPQPFVPSNPLLAVSGNYVVVDAVAADDADALRVDLEKLGLQNVTTFGRMVSGRLPIASIDNLFKLNPLLRVLRKSFEPGFRMTNDVF